VTEVISQNQTTIYQQQVDRSRRYWFISRLTAFCLVVSGFLSVFTGFGFVLVTPIIELYVRSLLTLATAAVMAYITGSVIDYNGGIGNMFTAQSSATPVPSIPSTAPVRASPEKEKG
jgi:cytochrome b subunit of formate dehydrogenase